MLYILQRTDQGGGYVALPGSRASYTHRLEEARTWNTREEANRERCPGNEVVRSVTELLPRPQGS